MREFHISRAVRDEYQVEDTIFGLRGNVIFGNLNAARKLAQDLNATRDLALHPEQTVRAGDLFAMGLLDEILHFMIDRFRNQINPSILQQALDWLEADLGQETVDSTLQRFIAEFPTTEIFRGQTDLAEYWAGQTLGIPNRQIALEELLLLWLDNENPAYAPCLVLFDHRYLVRETAYNRLLGSLYDFFDTQPGFGPDEENLIDMLRKPALVSPNSLSGQLDYVRERWGMYVAELLTQLLSSLDYIREETKPTFPPGPGPTQVLEFGGLEIEPENFSPDLDWMPQLVLIAKNSYVWLDQLSKKYQRHIQHLDEIPDEELDNLARWGITGLWLIGLWERSQASRRIKQMRGNPEAVASAYSLYDYQIANALGGEEGYRKLRDRAWQRGIRLSADMVPNHMGIDSRWVIEHPDWFISLDYSPFPGYTFNGANLSQDDRVGIYLEDHYYNNSDAAVVFKRLDHWTGNTKFIYHGNDGTSMPWNDTAQLNFLLPEVREAVIQTILHVARKFPIIRFDAAMTLSKKHFQRLWFPEPGSGGDIPSRAEFGLTRDQFDSAMPVEFWREVVDRVAVEAPDTLLLAEAFWLMEGYFVRTLGMHRVYNSAFMNLLRDEKNAEYRLVIKNTLEFDPEILKRYVNFMNNPDEKTAIEQFGKGDKYFGICILLATMPGLPMIGHGQIEGFSEKYGMEYQRAYWDESVDQSLVARHEREVFPLLRRRHQFAQVENFLLFDFYTADGSVNEDVFAYSNRSGETKSLVLYNNRYSNTAGWIKTSAAYMVKVDQTDQEKMLQQKNLAEGLSLDYSANLFTIFKDHITGLEYIRNNKELHERGLYVELQAYQYHVFVGFRQVVDTDWHAYGQLAASLSGRGVPNLEEALREQILQPLHEPFRELCNATLFRWITSQRIQREKHDGTLYLTVLEDIEVLNQRWLAEVKQFAKGDQNDTQISNEIIAKLKVLLNLPILDQIWKMDSTHAPKMMDYLGIGSMGSDLGTQLTSGDPRVWGVLLSWLFTHSMGQCLIENEVNAAETSRNWLDEWLLSKIIKTALVDLGLDGFSAGNRLDLIRVLVAHHHWWENIEPVLYDRDMDVATNTPLALLRIWLNDEAFQAFIGMNRFNDIVWFNKEAFEEMMWWLFLVSVIDITTKELSPDKEQKARNFSKTLESCFNMIQKLLTAESNSDYQIDKLLEAVGQDT
jgi:glycosidase